jgi:PIN domain nuclease of toxin-antitoxin system
MNIIIDTHLLLWTLCNKDKLSSKEQRILTNNANNIYVSVMSIWEISLKSGIGKLELHNFDVSKLPDYITKTGFEIINLESKEASTFHTLPKTDHKDPFDRMIIWQTICKEFCLLTRDKAISSYCKYGLKLI